MITGNNEKVIVCLSCGQPGHEENNCSLCSECGSSKHISNKCPGIRYCNRCKLRGHSSAECTNRSKPEPCSICDISYHDAINCPSLLHVYDGEVKSNVKVTPYCYNCAQSGHYGDECPSLHMKLEMSPSAFSQYNVDSNRFLNETDE